MLAAAAGVLTSGCLPSFPTESADGGSDATTTADAPSVETGAQDVRGGDAAGDGRVASDGGALNDAGTTNDGDTPDAGMADAGMADGGGCADGQAVCNGSCASLESVRTCGSCDNDCTALPHVSLAGLACTAGRCVYQCTAAYADCTDAGQGCASSLAAAATCGSCATACTSAMACSANDGGAYACAATCGGSTPSLCNGLCVNEQNDKSNCGGCGPSFACAGGQTCISGSCKVQLTAASDPVTATVGTAFTGPVAIVTDAITSDGASAIAAVIDWGDGTSTSGTVSGSAGSFTVSATHTYASPGAVTLKVTVNDAATGASAMTSGAGTVQCAAGTSACSGACVDEQSNETPNAPNCGGCGSAYTCSGGAICTTGACACPAGQSTCGGSSCIALAGTDASNCGACGHSCLGGTCSNGVCQPFLFATGLLGSYATNLGSFGELWVDSTAVYARYQGTNAMNFESLDKSTATALGAEGDYSGLISSPSGSTIYSSAHGPCSCPWQLYAWPLPSLTPMSTPYNGSSPGASASGQPSWIAAQGTTLAWTDTNMALNVGSTDGSSAVVVQDTRATGVLVADANGFVWASSVAGLMSARLLPASQPTTVSTPSGANVTQAVLDGGFVYWFNSADSSIYRSARDGSTTHTLLASPVSVVQLAIDGTNVYWASATTGTIDAVPKNATGNTTPTVLASGQMSLEGIAVDPGATGSIYFSGGSGGNQIFRLAK